MATNVTNGDGFQVTGQGAGTLGPWKVKGGKYLAVCTATFSAGTRICKFSVLMAALTFRSAVRPNSVRLARLSLTCRHAPSNWLLPRVLRFSILSHLSVVPLVVPDPNVRRQPNLSRFPCDLSL
jgi:hypothetical protein